MKNFNFLVNSRFCALRMPCVMTRMKSEVRHNSHFASVVAAHFDLSFLLSLLAYASRVMFHLPDTPSRLKRGSEVPPCNGVKW
jgi:hypothetical protein